MDEAELRSTIEAALENKLRLALDREKTLSDLANELPVLLAQLHQSTDSAAILRIVDECITEQRRRPS